MSERARCGGCYAVVRAVAAGEVCVKPVCLREFGRLAGRWR